MMRKIVFLTSVALAAMSSTVARAELVLSGGTPANSLMSGEGFGAIPRLLRLDTGGSVPFESGQFFNGIASGDTGSNCVTGGNFCSNPTVGSLQWTSGAKVGIIFNSDQSGNSGLTVQTTTIHLFNGTTDVAQFPLAAPVQFTGADLALEPGVGNGGFAFVLTDAEQTAFNADLVEFGSGLTVGLAASAGCGSPGPTGNCDQAGGGVANDGPEDWFAFAVPGPVVGAGLPGLIMAGGGLLGWWRRKRKGVAAA